MKITSTKLRIFLVAGAIFLLNQGGLILYAQNRITTEMERVLRQREEEQKIIEVERARMIKERVELLTRQTLDGNLDPKEYIVGPGDLFSIYIWGKVDRQFEAIVSPEGNLEIPTVGLVFVGGTSLEEAKKKIIGKCGRVYSEVEISALLVQLRKFRIYVTGNIFSPGTYPLRGVDRISDAIESAGGLTGLTDGSNIMITSKDGSVRSFDYLKYVYEGDLNNNYLLMNGDVINVPTLDWSGNIVTIESYDDRSGSFSLKEGENLESLLKRTGVFSRLSDANKIYVSRQRGDKEEIFPVGSSIQDMNDFIPVSGDRIIIPILSQAVYITGEVANPGPYPFIPDLTAKDYLGYAGGVTSNGNAGALRIIRDGKSIKGDPESVIRRGDTVNISRRWTGVFRDVFDVIFPITSIILSAKAAGL